MSSTPFANTPEPPYYAVMFTSLRNGADAEGYAEAAERMLELAVQQPGYLGVESAVSYTHLDVYKRQVRNDELTVDEIEAMNPSGIVISPGPCTPNEAGVSVDVIRRLGDRIPILGVCLGHQSIGQALSLIHI